MSRCGAPEITLLLAAVHPERVRGARFLAPAANAAAA
jgi:hypothetical protein